MRNNLGDTEEKLEAQTIAQSEWERLSHMSLDELEANRETFKIPYSAGTGNQFTISVNLGQKGTFNNGTCGALSGGYANCFQNTTITVYQDGNRVFTTRTLPLMAGDYTRKEIDSLLASMKNDYINRDNALKNDYTSKINNEATARANAVNSLTSRLNGKEFVKNKTTNYDLNLRYEKKSGETSATMHAYVGDTEIEFGSGGGGGFPDMSKPTGISDSGTGTFIDNEYFSVSRPRYYDPAILTVKKDIWCRQVITIASESCGQHGDNTCTSSTFIWHPLSKGSSYNMQSFGNGAWAANGRGIDICYPAK